MEAERAGTLREQRTKPTTYRMCRTRKSFYRGTLGFARLRQERERVRVHNIRTPSFQPESPPLSVLLPTSPSAVVSRYTQCEETERVLLNERIVSAVGPIRRKSEQQALPDSFIQFFIEHACTRTEKKRKKERKKKPQLVVKQCRLRLLWRFLRRRCAFFFPFLTFAGIWAVYLSNVLLRRCNRLISIWHTTKRERIVGLSDKESTSCRPLFMFEEIKGNGFRSSSWLLYSPLLLANNSTFVATSSIPFCAHLMMI